MDWRQLRENQANGLVVEPERWRGIQELVDRYGDWYLNGRAKKLKAEGKPLPDDPYRRQWHGSNARTMFTDVRADEYYDLIYEIASERIHWNPRAMLRSLDIVDGPPRGYVRADPRAALSALMAGFAALHQSLELLDQQFGLGLEADLESLLMGFSGEAPAGAAIS